MLLPDVMVRETETFGIHWRV